MRSTSLPGNAKQQELSRGNEAKSIAERLLEFRGSGGKSQQKRKFAAALADTNAQGQKISYVAHKRRIERVEATDPEEDDSE